MPEPKTAKSNTPSLTPPAEAQAAATPAPAEAEPTFTKAELDALVQDAIKKANEPYAKKVAELEDSLKKAQSLTPNEKSARVRAEAFAIKHDLPASFRNVLERVIEPAEQDAILTDYLKDRPAKVDASALASANEKLRARNAAEENIPPLGQGASGVRPAMSWSQAQRITNVNDLSDAEYAKLVK